MADVFSTLEALMLAVSTGKRRETQLLENKAAQQGAPPEFLLQLVESARRETTQLIRPASRERELSAALGLVMAEMSDGRVIALTEAATAFFRRDRPVTPATAVLLLSEGVLSLNDAEALLEQAQTTGSATSKAAGLYLYRSEGGHVRVVAHGKATGAEDTFVQQDHISPADCAEFNPSESLLPKGGIDAIAVLREVLEAQEERAEAKGLRLHFLADDALLVLAREDDLRSIAHNLIANAIDACARGRRVRVSALQDGDWSEIRVTDEGSGMDSLLRDKAFEPFFSTKGAPGLGLPTVRHLVQRLAGTLQLETTVEEGTTMIVRLPLA